MAGESALIAAGWLLAGGLGVALAASVIRARRRREHICAALHELRRPLQRLVLASEPSAQASELAVGALAGLERAVAGECSEPPPRPVALRPLVERALEPFTSPHRVPGARPAPVALEWSAGSPVVRGDPDRLGRALENLIANALEHGRPPAQVSVSASSRGVRLTVANPVGSPEASGRARGPLRGHGLRLVAAVARASGGRFLFDRDERSAVATLELPVVGSAPGTRTAA